MYFKKKLTLIVSAISIVLLQSCATVKMTSNKQAGYTKQPKRIYIMASCSKEGELFCRNLGDGLKKDFTNRGIASEFYLRSALALDTEEDISKKLNDFKPEAALFIRQTVTGGGQGTYELTLVDGETKKNVWKSEVITSTDGYTSDIDLLDKGVRTVVNKLIEDKII